MGANGSSTWTSLPAFTATRAIGSGTCARPKPSMAAPRTVTQAGMLAQIVDALRPLSTAQIIGAADDHEWERRRQPHCDHVGCDELAQPDASVKSFGRDVRQLRACGDLDLHLGISSAEGCEQRLQQDWQHRTRHREAQQSGRPLSELTRDRACGDELLEGGLCARKESFAGFGQADAARRAQKERGADARLECSDRLSDRRWTDA